MASLSGSPHDLRVLFLHDLDSAPGGEKQRLLEKAVGKQRMKSPNLRTRQSIMMFVLLFLILAACLVGACIVALVLAKLYIFFIVVVASVVVLVLAYWLGGRGATHYMWSKAVRVAEKKFKEQRPNVIVATSFGAVVALSMDVPKIPMLLLCPALAQYARFMRLKKTFSLQDIPYVLIVHGSGDKTIPLDDSIRLLETAAGPGRCRLEVINDGHALKAIKPEDLREWVEEVYVQGKKQVKILAETGAKDVDASVFNWEETGATEVATIKEDGGHKESTKGSTAASQDSSVIGSV